MCEGKELLITQNLEAALKRVRSEEKVVSIWADQVCIDQNNLQERATQVGLMGQIYSTAGPVVTWLGSDPANHAGQAFSVLRRFTKSPDLYDVCDCEVAALTELARCAYFSRLWVMQEITNSSHKAAINRVLWGPKHEITVQDLTVGLFHVVRLTIMSSFQWKAFRWIPEVIGHENIFEILAWVRSRQCSDDRDRIYGIIRITMRGDSFWNRWMDSIVPDYTLSTAQVYRGVALQMVKYGAVAFMLNSVHHRELVPWKTNAWPSWIPKWNEDIAFDLKMYKYNPEEHINAETDIQESQLRLSCLPIGVVSRCSRGELLPEINSLTNESLVFDACINFTEIYCFWAEVIRRHENSPDTSADLWRQVHFACVFSAPAKDELGELDKCGELLQTADLELRQSEMIASASSANVTIMLDRLRTCLAQLRVAHGIHKLEEDTPNLAGKETFRGRKVFSASNGLLGLGPVAMQSGDMIMHIPGSNTPFVLRERDEFFQFVGAASIPTTLRLAAIDQVSKQVENPRHIEIR